MVRTNDLATIQSCIRNPLDRRAVGKKRIVGIIGDSPSRYAKSPSIWNAVFEALKIDAVYQPFDVDADRLPDLLRAFRESHRVLGANVTVPYKVTIIKHLDALDENVGRIQAVNTIVRGDDGTLHGFNTDGSGFLESLLHADPSRDAPFVKDLKHTDVLMIGAGGSARAVAFHMAAALEGGKLVISNRTIESARSLAQEIDSAFGNGLAIDESEIGDWASKVGLIVNCTTKGQGGIRRSDGNVTILEPYSAVAPANPALFPESGPDKPGFYRDWLRASLADVEANNRISWQVALSIPLETPFCDLIYFPAETVFLRHGRLSGHRTLNGKGMNVAQAADALYNKVCREYLQKRGLRSPRIYRRIREIMWRAW